MHSHATLFFLLLLHHCQSCHVEDEAGLLAFKSGIKSDPSGILSSWQPGTDCCRNWSGVYCNSTNGRVFQLFIQNEANLRGEAVGPNNTLSGTISPSLSKLRYLDSLYLLDLGNITGPFPNSIFSLSNITILSIRNSGLSGRIPNKISSLKKLEFLVLAENKFSGRIPSLASLALLQEVDLSNNRLTGPIPHSFNRLRNLVTLKLGGNRLNGSIPEIFTTMKSLTFLNLSGNYLSGNVPNTLKNLKAMRIYLSHNALTGPVPDYLPYRNLIELDLSWNKLSGSVPSSFSNFTKISTIDLSHNKLRGSSFPQLRYPLEALDLSYNNFQFQNIPRWIGATPVKSLNLARCGIKMKLHDWKPTVSFVNIDLSQNELTGNAIPLLVNHTRLEEFRARGNKLKFDLEKLKIRRKLKYLDVSENLLFGSVPAIVSRLQYLNVSGNHLCGQLPVTSFPASTFLGNDCLCGIPLPPCKP